MLFILYKRNTVTSAAGNARETRLRVLNGNIRGTFHSRACYRGS